MTDGRERLRQAGARHDRLGDRAHRTIANVVVAEVDENPALYDEGHIRGAVRLHWRDDLQDPVERDLIERAEFEQLMGGLGISNDTIVVLYGDRNNWFAAYAYWYLKIYGHKDVRILDGGRQKWIDERPRADDGRAVAAAPATYTANERDASIRTFRDDVLSGLGDGARALVDVRSPQEYSGELIAPPGYEQEGAQRAGTSRRRSRSRGRRPCATTERSRAPTS